MMPRTRVPAIDGWFTLDDEPRLIGTKCVDSGTIFFPPETTMSRAPGFASSELVEVNLSRTGTLWSYTNAGYQPPEPYIAVTDPYEPFWIAAVHLEAEQMVVLGQVATDVPREAIKVGAQMELVLDVLYSDEDNDYMMWKWQPVGWSSEKGDQ
ncbi:MAG: OB-fold domain-containing protein [Microthrixaceae bacterium]|nr:OB-fold domain-containing protein [Microthrixaceae bacterium]